MLSRTSSHGFLDETQSSALTSPRRKVLPSGSVEPAAALCHGSHVVSKLWSFLRDLSIRLRLTIPRRTSFGNLVQHGYACRTICLDTRSIRNGGRSPKNNRKGHDHLKGPKKLVRKLLLLGMHSRFGSERTLTASHHAINQVVAPPPADYFLSKNDLFVIATKSGACLRLAYVKTPLLQPPPICSSQFR
jgi:hypothetical protein